LSYGNLRGAMADEFVSVEQAAEELGLTRQAVLKRSVPDASGDEGGAQLHRASRGARISPRC